MGTQSQNRPNFSTDFFVLGLEFFHTAYSGDREQRFRRKANSSPDDDEQLSG